MPKEFYTERDIEDMARRGVQSLVVNDNVVLTELAFEKAERLGVQLIRPNQTPPSAPVRPYLSQETAKPGFSTTAALTNQQSSPDLSKRIHEAVVARLGTQVDPTLLDAIINRVLNNVGLK